VNPNEKEPVKTRTTSPCLSDVFNLVMYVATPNGTLLKYDPKTGVDNPISENIDNLNLTKVDFL